MPNQLYIYPVKSLRGIALPAAELTDQGFPFDRRFMLVKIQCNGSNGSQLEFRNMHVPDFPQMTLFHTEISLPSGGDNRKRCLHVTHRSPAEEGPQALSISLFPDTTSLDVVDISMHSSSSKAYRMDSQYNDWFSERFGFEVNLIYLGDNSRPVLMTQPGIAASMFSLVSNMSARLGLTKPTESRITFADVAPYLVVSQTSVDNVSARLPPGQAMDVTKFRPNIVIEGAESAWGEDFWGEITLGTARMSLEHNCVRCISINIDYATAQHGTDESGQVFKKLQKDRRIDSGSKYSPVFGRYGFITPGNRGLKIAVGDEVTVTRKNAKTTTFGKISLDHRLSPRSRLILRAQTGPIEIRHDIQRRYLKSTYTVAGQKALFNHRAYLNH